MIELQKYSLSEIIQIIRHVEDNLESNQTHNEDIIRRTKNISLERKTKF